VLLLLTPQDGIQQALELSHMCGLAAWFSYRHGAPLVNGFELVRVRDAMTRRGPDGAGLWVSADERVGLAHRRLSIIDLSETGAQPMVDGDQRLRIVFNGEIYNYRELRSSLETKGVRFKSTSDTEVLLHLYADKGPEMLNCIRGMYAFALWDEPQRCLFLARDPFGIKPLYYADNGMRIVVASQLRALRLLPDVDHSADTAATVGFLLWGYVPEPYTVSRGVRALPAGCSLIIEDGKAPLLRRFCSISHELAQAEQDMPVRLAFGEVCEQLRAVLAGTVRRHLIADVPVGLFLSAGLDSNTVAGLATEIADSQLRTLTLGFSEYRDTSGDEVQLAAAAARHWTTVHETCWVDQAEFESELERLLNAMDQPSIDGVNTYFVSKAAAASGLKVAISGLGGDELFGGYSSFRDVPRIVRLLGKYPLPRAGAAMRAIAVPLISRFTSPKYAGIVEYGSNYSGAYLLRRGLFMPWELPLVLDPAIAREGWETLDPIMQLEANIAEIHSEKLKMSALEMNWYMRNQLLRDSDWAGMAHSLEIRVPLVDLDLLRTVARLSKHLHVKAEMAQAVAKPMPLHILNREKTGFATPVDRWTGSKSRTPLTRGLRGWALRLIQHFGMYAG
jgi:asparagine synthase (glutamine-hydrolysing)